jgi:hypothetical protein
MHSITAAAPHAAVLRQRYRDDEFPRWAIDSISPRLDYGVCERMGRL